MNGVYTIRLRGTARNLLRNLCENPVNFDAKLEDDGEELTVELPESEARSLVMDLENEGSAEASEIADRIMVESICNEPESP